MFNHMLSCKGPELTGAVCNMQRSVRLENNAVFFGDIFLMTNSLVAWLSASWTMTRPDDDPTYENMEISAAVTWR